MGLQGYSKLPDHAVISLESSILQEENNNGNSQDMTSNPKRTRYVLTDIRPSFLNCGQSFQDIVSTIQHIETSLQEESNIYK